MVVITKEELYPFMLLAYEAWKRAGQVEMEEFMDNEMLWLSFIESIVSEKTWMPIRNHASNKKVEYNLRSDQWRKKTLESSKKYMDDAINMLHKYIEKDLPPQTN